MTTASRVLLALAILAAPAVARNPLANPFALTTERPSTPEARAEALAGTEETQSFLVANHQWLYRDHSWYQAGQNNAGLPGFSYVFQVDPPAFGTPIAVRVELYSTNTSRWFWENRDPNNSIPAPTGKLCAKHLLFMENGEGGRTEIDLLTHCHDFYDTTDLDPFDGQFIYDNGWHCGSDGWIGQCFSGGNEFPCMISGCTGPASSVQQDNSGIFSPGLLTKEQWDVWLDGPVMAYIPELYFSQASVPWETNHHWWNWSDMRSTVEVRIVWIY